MNEQELEVIKEFQQTDSKVSIVSICKKLGIEVYTAQMDNSLSGAILLKEKTSENDDDKYQIYVNKNEKHDRQRFTVAHELAHFLLHKDKIGKNLTDRKGGNGLMYRSNLSDIFEMQANILATEILMPIDLISRHIKSGIDDISKLAKKLEVPEEDLKRRLDNLRNVFLDI